MVSSRRSMPLLLAASPSWRLSFLAPLLLGASPSWRLSVLAPLRLASVFISVPEMRLVDSRGH